MKQKKRNNKDVGKEFLKQENRKIEKNQRNQNLFEKINNNDKPLDRMTKKPKKEDSIYQNQKWKHHYWLYKNRKYYKKYNEQEYASK